MQKCIQQIGLSVKEVATAVRGDAGEAGEHDHRKAKGTIMYTLFQIIKAKNAQLNEFLRCQLLKDL
jgi:hypothetical protein